MSIPIDPGKKHSSTDIIQQSLAEQERLRSQDVIFHKAMGGALPEQTNPEKFCSVLDIACGAGGWLIEAAKAYPHMKRLIGIDISPDMVALAQEQARLQGCADRVQFRVMNALGRLAFPDQTFDLVNQRLGSSYVRSWEWPALLKECQRVARRGAVIRLTEFSIIGDTTSPAFAQLSLLFVQARQQAGYLLSEELKDIVNQPAFLLEQQGLHQVQTQVHPVAYHAGTPAGQQFYAEMKALLPSVEPFIRKWKRMTDNYQELTQEALHDMLEPGFVARATMLTAWGIVP